MRPHRLAVLACAAALAACAEGPFIDHDINVQLDKPVDTVAGSGVVYVCYGGDEQFAAAEAMAAKACAAYGLQSFLVRSDRYQCRLTTPHRALFRCFHPDMLDAHGEPINPFSRKAVKDWERRTGKQPPASLRRNPAAPQPQGGESPEAPAAEAAPPAPPAAVLTPVPSPAPKPAAPPRPPGPADIPSWPQAQPPAPPPAPIVAPAPLAPESFTLPVGTWGDAFDQE
ncbi:MAG: hypothetical protein AB1918_16385 [Pseudomonadota bacterium]